MTVPCNSVSELQQRLTAYLMMDRPLNLDEMRNAQEILQNVVNGCKELIRYGKMRKQTALETLSIQSMQRILGPDY